MKNVLLFILFAVTAVSLMACARPNLELSDFADAYIEAGYEVDLEEKPLYGLISAKDAFIFYLDGEKVAVYEYESSNDLEDSKFEFDAVNGRFGLESDSEEAIEIFKNLGN